MVGFFFSDELIICEVLGLVFVATGVCIAVSWLRRGLVIGGFIHLM
jgi:hypothetical protein